MGTPPFVFANRVLGTHGIDPSTEITWKVFPAGELGLALSKGEVDAVANAEPIGTLLIAQGTARNVEGMDEATDEPYASEYCCEIIANGKWIDANPDTRRPRDPCDPERGGVGAAKPEGCGTIGGGQEISRFDGRTKHRRDQPPEVHSVRH